MPKTILLIEDDLPTIDVYQTALKQAKFKIDVITSGEDALKRIKEIKQEKVKKPDLILLDLILPDINGLEVLEEIRKNKETKDLLLFIFTNYSVQQLEKMGYNLKAEKCLNKLDYPPTKLVKLIKEELKKK